jgi:hypothetical protein
VIVLPGSEYLDALLRTLPNTWESRTGSASRRTGASGRDCTRDLTVLVELSARGLDGGLEHFVQRHRLAAQLELATGDPRDVEQVVEQSGHVPALPVDHRRRRGNRRRRALVLQQRDAGANRRQRVAQLVGQHGQELVPAAIGVAQRRLQRLALVDVAGDRRGADDAAGLVANRRQGDRHRQHGAVAGDALGLELRHAFAVADAAQELSFLGLAMRWDDPGDRAADGLGGGVAEHLLGAGIPRQDDPGERLGEDGVCRRLDHGRQQRLRAIGLEALLLFGVGLAFDLSPGLVQALGGEADQHAGEDEQHDAAITAPKNVMYGSSGPSQRDGAPRTSSAKAVATKASA